MFVGTNMDFSLGETKHRAAFVVLSANNVLSRSSVFEFEENMVVIDGEAATNNVVDSVFLGCTAIHCVAMAGKGATTIHCPETLPS